MRSVLLAAVLTLTAAVAAEPKPWWGGAVEAALKRAGDNRAKIADALARVPAAQRPSLAFLVEHMPERDLKALSAEFLLAEVDQAHAARKAAPWAVSDEVFREYVLPYANLDESRDPWRAELRAIALPLVAGCKTPSEAAQKINAGLFAATKVRYSTRRRKANQSPKETMASGLASCTGLSVLLVDACRSVGIPARVVGTPLWADRSGNHTWVEVYDGRWMFTGAAEQDPMGLDRGWFTHRASQAKPDDPAHGIFAAKWSKSATAFPLVWSPRSRDVNAENVTARYAAKQAVAAGKVRVGVRVKDAEGRRVSLPVMVCEKGQVGSCARLVTKNERNDTNDIAAVELTPGREYSLKVGDPVRTEKAFTAEAKEFVVDVALPAEDATAAVKKAALAFFAAPADKRDKLAFPAELDAALKKDEKAVRAAVEAAWREASMDAEAKKDAKAKVVRSGKHESAYTLKFVGKKPAAGWPLFVAMHGGGGVPKAFNDSQWRHMQIYYRDQPGDEGYAYVALRAPNDTWNGFYDTYVPPLICALIKQMTLFHEIDPTRVHLMGYSHGGYGAFYIGPRIPDRFATVHASASAPSDANDIARNLRNLTFTFMIGEKDTAYGRIDRCRAFDKEVAAIKAAEKDGYPVKMEYIAGVGHGGLPDRDKIKTMLPTKRVTMPPKVTWHCYDTVVEQLYWVRIAKPTPGMRVEASAKGNKVELKTAKVGELELLLDARLVDYAKPLEVTRDGKTTTVELKPSVRTLCETMAAAGDPTLAATCRVGVK